MRDLAIDDIDMRAKNTERLLKTVDSVGDLIKDMKKQSKINFYIGLFMSVFFIFITTFRIARDALDFKQLFNASCTYYEVGNEV